MKDYSREVESVLERDCCFFAFQKGWKEWKVISPSRRGFPDRIFLKDGHVIFAEFKRPGEKPTELQAKLHKEMILAGADVRVYDDYDLFCQDFS